MIDVGSTRSLAQRTTYSGRQPGHVVDELFEVDTLEPDHPRRSDRAHVARGRDWCDARKLVDDLAFADPAIDKRELSVVDDDQRVDEVAGRDHDRTRGRHRDAFSDSPIYRSMLDVGGDYAVRVRGEDHVWTAETVARLLGWASVILAEHPDQRGQERHAPQCDQRLDAARHVARFVGAAIVHCFGEPAQQVSWIRGPRLGVGGTGDRVAMRAATRRTDHVERERAR